ncbi:hypothetical protein [Paraburkholderia sp. IW21]|uniref:hypothetical protein n=1 Tax=Paraburkholderia sp. IW21 TaxID=3242488 RepID=UPI00351F818C
MATASGLASGPQGKTPESLLALAEYLELSLDEGKCLVMIRQDIDICAVYVGDPTGPQDDFTSHGTIAARLADEILESTQAGANRVTIGDQTYRFIRSFMQIDDSGAVVFAPM